VLDRPRLIGLATAAVLVWGGAAWTTPPASAAGSPLVLCPLGERSVSIAQNAVASFPVPTTFRGARLLLALVAADGPDSVPVGTARTATSAVIAGTTHLSWTRAAHVSARQDWAAPGDQLERFGASIAEIWTAIPTPQWKAQGTITITNSHHNKFDDGMATTVIAFANGQLLQTSTIDGLANRPETLALTVPEHSAVYSATFAGRVNASFTPLTGFHLIVQRRAGDDTAGVLASNSHDLAPSTQRVGYSAPNPGDYWELAAAVITPTHTDTQPAPNGTPSHGPECLHDNE
jgi:hypothetical protein